MGHEVVRTRGGLWAMRSLEADEVMHPGVGPLAEAEALYVRQSRFVERLREVTTGAGPLVVFDIGLGAASNALAARAESERAPASARRLQLVSFENDLGALRLALEHGAAFGLEGEPAVAARALLEVGAHESPRTRWSLRHGELLDRLATEPERADVVYWDPFSPRANPTLWTVAAFASLRRVSAPGCTLYTYSSSTRTRVALLLAGWAVGVGDAIGDRRETTAAALTASDLVRPLDRRWLSRLERPEAPLPSDAPAGVLERLRGLTQFAA